MATFSTHPKAFIHKALRDLVHMNYSMHQTSPTPRIQRVNVAHMNQG